MKKIIHNKKFSYRMIVKKINNNRIKEINLMKTNIV